MITTNLPTSPSPVFDNEVYDNGEVLSSIAMDTEIMRNEQLTIASKLPQSKVSSLAVSWAKKYYSTITAYDKFPQLAPHQKSEIEEEENRAKIADKLLDTLKVACDMAWSKVENLLAGDIQRHAISPDLIRPSDIIADSRRLYQHAINAYAEEEPPTRLSVLMGRQIIEVRRRYSEADPLVLGFVTMQFHYVSQILLGNLTSSQRSYFVPYLKIIDDYLHIPFGDIHEAAANHDPKSISLKAVQHLLSCTTPIAHSVYDRVSAQHLGYRSSTGELTNEMVKMSSIRDVEIFQSYLCLCALEGSIRPIQEELFPISVMLYPRLHVSWKLVQDMLLVLFWEIHDRLPSEDLMVFLPYLRTLTEMFSDEVFRN
jgi:hypothetical protein